MTRLLNRLRCKLGLHEWSRVTFVHSSWVEYDRCWKRVKK